MSASTAGTPPSSCVHDQYTLDPGAGVPPPDAMDEVVPKTLDALLAGTLPDPTTLARDLGPLAADRRLQMWSADPPAQQLLDQVGLSEELPALDGREGWAVTLSNRGDNRLDGFLVPVISYRSIVDPDSGAATATIRVRLTNNAAPGAARADVIDNALGLPQGTSRVYVSAYSSLALGGDDDRRRGAGDPVVHRIRLERLRAVRRHSAGRHGDPRIPARGHVDRPGEVVTWQQPMAVEAP